MARVFLDANYFIDVIFRDPTKGGAFAIGNHKLLISVLSIHIYCYSIKIKVPNKYIETQIAKFALIDMSEAIVNSALLGPTSDFEDNIQLHSAVEAECDYFLTSDKKLLAMKFFGKAKIVSSLF